MAREAPPRGITLFTEPRLAPFWPCPIPYIDTARLDALLTFGGDGTLLRGARLLTDLHTSILGVNLGRVGFLTTATLDTLGQALDASIAPENREVEAQHLGLRRVIQEQLVRCEPECSRETFLDLDRATPIVGNPLADVAR